MFKNGHQFYYPFFEEIIAVITSPKPIPDKMHATIYNGEVCKKASPTPTPTMVIPPIAQVLLSSFLFFTIHWMNTKF